MWWLVALAIVVGIVVGVVATIMWIAINWPMP